MLRINEIAPNFSAVTTNGNIDFHDWIDGSWVILFSLILKILPQYVQLS